MNKKNFKVIIVLIMTLISGSRVELFAGEPVTGLLICCRGSNMGPFLVNGQWNMSHDYGDIEQVRSILTDIQEAGINIVYIDMTNPSQWTRLWDQYEPMIENIRTVCAEKEMEYFIMIGAVVTDVVRKNCNISSQVGHLEWWNEKAKFIWDNYAQDNNYRTYGYGDDRKIITMFYPGVLVDELWDEAPEEHKTYLSKFYRGTHQYNERRPNGKDGGWGYRDQQQNVSGTVRFVCASKGMHPAESSFITKEQWKDRLAWAAEAEHYSV